MRRNYMKTLIMLACCLFATSTQAENFVPQKGDAVITDDGKYIVTGDNLIDNPSFDEGFSGWKAGDGSDLTADNFEVTTEGGADGGACLNALQGAGSGSNKSIKTGWPIEIGKTYVFTCWAKRTASGISSNTQYSRLFQGDSETDAKSQFGTLTYVADTWIRSQFVFTAEKAYCVANFGWLNSATSFDCFFLGTIELSDELMTEKLETLIAEAGTLYDNTAEGNEKGEYSTTVREALQSAITAANGVLSSAADQAEINKATETLAVAITVYKNSVNPPFAVGTRYSIIHRGSGLFMTSAGSAGTLITISGEEDSNTQIFTFEPAPEGAEAVGYNLKDGDGNYIYRSGSWNTFSGSIEATEPNAIFNVIEDGDYVQIKCMGSGSVLGTDGTSDGAGVYSNKNGSGVANYNWTLKVYVPFSERDDEYLFNTLLSKAQNQLSSIDQSLMGTGLFKYSQSAYDTYGAAIQTAQGMSDFSAARTYLQAAMDAFATNSINRPDTSKNYTIIQSSGQSLVHFADDAVARIAAANGAENRQFSFVASKKGDAYAIRNAATGYYLCKSTSSAWDTYWSETNSGDEAYWIIAPCSEECYTLTNLAGKGCLGSNAITDSSAVYCDKNASLANSQWKIDLFSITTALDKQIAIAETLATNTTVGSNYDQVPQAAMDALLAAVQSAKTALPGIATFEESAAAALLLEDAVNTFRSSFNPILPFDTSKTYNIVHYSGNLLTVTGIGNAQITAETEEDTTGALQQIVLVAVPCDTLSMLYNVKSAAQNLYLAAAGTYATEWQERSDTLTAIFRIVQLEGKYLGLKCMSNSLFLGTDATLSGSSVYSDKIGKNNRNAYWTIENSIKVTIDRAALGATLNNADSLAATMIMGYQEGEYFLSDMQAFADTIAKAKTIYNSCYEQSEIDAANERLKADIVTYTAKAHTGSVTIAAYMADLLPIYQAECDAIVPGTKKGDYPAAAKQTYQEAIETARTAEANEAALQALLTARSTFLASVITVDHAALTAAVAAANAAIDKAVAGDCNGQYPQDAISTYRTAIATAQTLDADMTLTQEQVNEAVENLKESSATFAAAMVKIDFTALKNGITDASRILSEAAPESGEGPGTYPESAFTTLQNAIDAAKLVNGSNTVNQIAVDAEVTVLSEAVAVFRAMRLPNDYSQLEILLTEARLLYAETSVGEEDGMVSAEAHEALKTSIDKNEPFMNSTVQTEIDKAVKLLTRDIALFKKSVINTGVNDILAEEGEKEYYDLTGKRVEMPANGLYIVKQGTKSSKVLIK